MSTNALLTNFLKNQKAGMIWMVDKIIYHACKPIVMQKFGELWTSQKPLYGSQVDGPKLKIFVFMYIFREAEFIDFVRFSKLYIVPTELR